VCFPLYFSISTFLSIWVEHVFTVSVFSLIAFDVPADLNFESSYCVTPFCRLFNGL
jgi:hypothetical protein